MSWLPAWLRAKQPASEPLDLSLVPDASVDELHRQAEKFLEGTIEFAVASDARAASLASIFGGASVAIAAAAATLVTSDETGKYSALISAGFVSALFFFAAAVLCARGGRPVSFHAAGYQPRRLQKSAADAKWMLRYVTEDIQRRIDFNAASLERSARLTRWGMMVAISAVPIAVLIFCVAQFGPGLCSSSKVPRGLAGAGAPLATYRAR